MPIDGAQMQALALEHHGAGEHGEDARRRTRRCRSTSRARIANSSPPSRATVSSARSALRRRSPQICSSRSPAAWPSESLTCLKSSRSRKATTAGSPRGQRLGDALLEQRAVGEAGQRVLEREAAQVVVAQAAAAGAVEQRRAAR